MIQRRIDILNYYVEDLIDSLKKVKNNPYGLKDSHHALNRAQKRGIDLNLVNKCIFDGLIVRVEKSLNESRIFELAYEHTKKEDLCIVINIINEKEIEIITLIEKNVGKRRHYAN